MSPSPFFWYLCHLVFCHIFTLSTYFERLQGGVKFWKVVRSAQFLRETASCLPHHPLNFSSQVPSLQCHLIKLRLNLFHFACLKSSTVVILWLTWTKCQDSLLQPCLRFLYFSFQPCLTDWCRPLPLFKGTQNAFGNFHLFHLNLKRNSFFFSPVVLQIICLLALRATLHFITQPFDTLLQPRTSKF